MRRQVPQQGVQLVDQSRTGRQDNAQAVSWASTSSSVSRRPYTQWVQAARAPTAPTAAVAATVQRHRVGGRDQSLIVRPIAMIPYGS